MDRELTRTLYAELARLGLEGKPDGFVADYSRLGELLGHVRSLPPGATWADLLARLNAHAGPAPRPPYRPLGPWDHATPPAEPTFRLFGPPVESAAWLQPLLTRAAAAGIPLHGGGTYERPGHRGPGPDHVWVTVKRGLSADALDEVVAWLEAQPEVYKVWESRPV